jgi:hypothetical protein
MTIPQLKVHAFFHSEQRQIPLLRGLHLDPVVEIHPETAQSLGIEDGKIATGGGSMATEIALKLRDYASSVGGREQMAIDAFADAIEVIPRTLAENAGLDPIDIVLSRSILLAAIHMAIFGQAYLIFNPKNIFWKKLVINTNHFVDSQIF